MKRITDFVFEISNIFFSANFVHLARLLAFPTETDATNLLAFVLSSDSTL